MEQAWKAFPLKPTVIAPASHGSPDDKAHDMDAFHDAHCDASTCRQKIAEYERDGDMPPKTGMVMPNSIEEAPRLHGALSNEAAAMRIADQHELPEDTIPSHVETKKRIRVPQIQSMDDYIKRYYARELMMGMLEDIRLRTGHAVVTNEVYEDTFYIGRMSFWRRSRTELIALIKMQLDACADKSNRIDRYEYIAKMYFEFSDEIEYKEISYRPYYRGSEKNVESECSDTMWLLDNHLIPYAKKETIEQRAWAMHCDFFPEAMPEQEDADTSAHSEQTAEQRRMERKNAIMREYSARELAERMGLDVIAVALYRKNRRKSFFNFRESQIQVLPDGSDGEKQKPVWITVPADTIVINTLRHEPDDGELSVFHECIHWYWHYLFFRLQALHNSDISALKKDHEMEIGKHGVKEALSCMEYQANRIKYALKMPLPVIRPLVGKLTEVYLPGSEHEGKTLENVARHIIEDRGIRPYQIRARLIQMGLIGAKGILNFEDRRYIAPFAFDHQNGSGDRVFFIRRKEALDEFVTNQEFRAQIQNGNYVYAEGHVCINDPRYVTQTSLGLMLTSWAKAHVDACCLRFISVYEMTDLIEYEFGRLASDAEYNNHYVNYVGTGGVEKTMAEHVLTNHRYTLALPGDFFDMLDVLRKDKGITQERLEEKSGVSAKKLSRERAKQVKTSKMNLTLDETIAICIGLEAPPWLSKVILARAGVSLNPFDSLHIIYEFILSCMFMDSIDTVQCFLKENGFPELTLKKGE